MAFLIYLLGKNPEVYNTVCDEASGKRRLRAPAWRGPRATGTITKEVPSAQQPRLWESIVQLCPHTLEMMDVRGYALWLSLVIAKRWEKPQRLSMDSGQ